MKYDGSNLEEVLEESRKFNDTMGYGGSRAVFEKVGIREFKAFTPMACPDAGAFIGWKKAIRFDNEQKEVIVKLLIPDDAKRSSALGRKCRCDKAVVVEIQDLDGSRLPDDTIAMSFHDNSFGYIVGRTVTPEKPFNEERFDECASGIHFFVNREEAVRYSYF